MTESDYDEYEWDEYEEYEDKLEVEYTQEIDRIRETSKLNCELQRHLQDLELELADGTVAEKAIIMENCRYREEIMKLRDEFPEENFENAYDVNDVSVNTKEEQETRIQDDINLNRFGRKKNQE